MNFWRQEKKAGDEKEEFRIIFINREFHTLILRIFNLNKSLQLIKIADRYQRSNSKDAAFGIKILLI